MLYPVAVIDAFTLRVPALSRRCALEQPGYDRLYYTGAV